MVIKKPEECDDTIILRKAEKEISKIKKSLSLENENYKPKENTLHLCSDCKSQKKTSKPKHTLFGTVVENVNCSSCFGTGIDLYSQFIYINSKLLDEKFIDGLIEELSTITKRLEKIELQRENKFMLFRSFKQKSLESKNK
ncbi:hypothetical protein [Salipaludibacillus agaradhaerens]|uniref:hypothetical protein n=1 Tax=Salipaludibacillus agaradhaerens TaxID=76935 RepID=UPI00215168A2|nr:hypothetical protein [Salipaludibacillus agaradhaerens]